MKLTQEVMEQAIRYFQGEKTMKVMVRFPGHEPDGPYKAERMRVGAQYFQVWIDGTDHELPASWCTVVPPGPEFPAGFPVAWASGRGVMHPWDPDRMNPADYTWPRAPWESAPDEAKQWLVFSDATTRWTTAEWRVGELIGNGTHVVHIEERG